MTAVEHSIDGIAFDQAGAGSPALIFVHGGFCDRDDWRAQTSALSPLHKVIALDLPGHGASVGTGRVSVDHFARAVRRVQAHCVGGPAILIGHGFGCSVIVEAFSQSPSAVLGIILIEGHPLAPTVKHSLPAAEKDGQGAREAMVRMFASMFLPGSDPAFPARMLSHVAGIDESFVAQLLACLADWQPKAPDILSRINVPLMLMESTSLADGLFAALSEGQSADWTQFVERLNRGATKYRIEGAGHFSPIEAADAVNQFIIDFAAYCAAQ